MGEAEANSEAANGPSRLGKYDIVARLGQGGMSKVYLAVAHGAVDEVRKLVVLKVLHEHLVHDEEYVEMFLREARIAVDLSHPNVVHTYTVGEEDKRYCIVMEYINGIPLSQVLSLARSQKWSLAERLPLMGALCLMLSGLNYVHDFRDLEGNLLRLVHRDLKPGNVLLGFDGQVKLLDFGVVKMTAPEHDQTERLSLKGTVQYLAPEALQGGRQIDRRYDVFAAGLILWEIVTGRRLWGSRQPLEIMRGLADDEMATIIDEAPEVPEELRPVLLKSLAADRDVRYANALELKSAIQSYLLTQSHRIDPENLVGIVSEGFGAIREKRQDVVSRRLREIREGTETSEPEVLLTAGPDSLTSGMASASATDITPSPSSLTPVSPMERPDTSKQPPPETAGDGRRAGLWGALLAVPVLAGLAYFGTASETEVAPAVAAGSPAAAQAGAGAPRTAQAAPAVADPKGAGAQEPASVAVTIVVDPPSATVEVDGEIRTGDALVLEGADPLKSHHVVARAAGYATETLDLKLTRSRTVDIELQPLAGNAEAAPPPTSRRRPRRRARGAADPNSEPEAAAAPEAPPEPAAPRPGDELVVKKKNKRDAKAAGIDSDIPWK